MIPDSRQQIWMQQAAESPSTAWGLYAQGVLHAKKDPQASVRELKASLGMEPVNEAAYELILAQQQDVLKDTKGAEAVAEEMSEVPELRATGLLHLWTLKLADIGSDSTAKVEFVKHLDERLSASHDVDEVIAMRNFAAGILNDWEKVSRCDERIRGLEPGWFPERSLPFVLELTDGNGVMRQVPMIGDDVRTVFSAYFIADDTPAQERIKQLQDLLTKAANPDVKEYLYQRLLKAAMGEKDNFSTQSYAESLLQLEPRGAKWLAADALSLVTTRGDLPRARREADRAKDALAASASARRPKNTDPDWYSHKLSDSARLDEVKRDKAMVLLARGAVLLDEGKMDEAELRLRQSLTVERTEDCLLALGTLMEKRGEVKQASEFRLQAKKVLADSVRASMVEQPGHDFTLQAVAGDKLHLKDQLGRPVLLYFFATWCGTCMKDEPLIVRMQKELGDRMGIVAISLDPASDRQKVEAMATEFHQAFPVLYDDGVAKQYEMGQTPPGIVVLDAAGAIRYKHVGLNERTMDEIASVLEILKSTPTDGAK